MFVWVQPREKSRLLLPWKHGHVVHLSGSICWVRAFPSFTLCTSATTTMRPFTYLTAVTYLATSVHTLPACVPESFAGALPANATILSAVSLANGSTYGEGAANPAYPTNPTNLPANCALVVNVTTSPSSNTRFGIFLPEQWNGRFLTVGNGGFAGGINWLDMGAGIRYGFAVVSSTSILLRSIKVLAHKLTWHVL